MKKRWTGIAAVLTASLAFGGVGTTYGATLTLAGFGADQTVEENAAPVKKEAKVFTAPEAVVMTTEAGEIISPINGKVIAAAEIPDPMFAQETMGPSVGVEPEEGVVYAPFDGSVMMLFPTKHAIGLVSEGGMEVLVHVGVDTVQMNGDGFEALVEQGAAIKKGDKLLTFDIDKIREAGHPATVIVALTNGFDYKDIKKAA